LVAGLLGRPGPPDRVEIRSIRELPLLLRRDRSVKKRTDPRSFRLRSWRVTNPLAEELLNENPRSNRVDRRRC